MPSKRTEIREEVIETFREYGGWWRLVGMAEWISAPIDEVRRIYDELEAEGLMERKYAK